MNLGINRSKDRFGVDATLRILKSKKQKLQKSSWKKGSVKLKTDVLLFAKAEYNTQKQKTIDLQKNPTINDTGWIIRSLHQLFQQWLPSRLKDNKQMCQTNKRKYIFQSFYDRKHWKQPKDLTGSMFPSALTWEREVVDEPFENLVTQNTKTI